MGRPWRRRGLASDAKQKGRRCAPVERDHGDEPSHDCGRDGLGFRDTQALAPRQTARVRSRWDPHFDPVAPKFDARLRRFAEPIVAVGCRSGPRTTYAFQRHPVRGESVLMGKRTFPRARVTDPCESGTLVRPSMARTPAPTSSSTVKVAPPPDRPRPAPSRRDPPRCVVQ